MSSENEQNLEAIRDFFNQELAKLSKDGTIGVANFQDVYNNLMPMQKTKLERMSDEQFQNLFKNGSIVCLGMAYPEFAIDAIDARLSDGTADKVTWNVYAKEYQALNRVLNATTKDIAERFGGVMIPSITGITVKKVEEYYGETISHRVVAENAGLGWRGKNELVISEKMSCALRFASIITNLPLPRGKKLDESCGDCTACLDACPILKNKAELKNYRENCWRYIMNLSLEAEVCGKCIKACYRKSIHKQKFRLR
jgi:epoxyqueuosine reductase QueG